DIFFGLTPATGQFAVSQLEAATVPATTPYTVTPANAVSYNDDLGVSYAASGKRFNRVTTPSAAGQYSVNFANGVYTFSSAGASAAVLTSYTNNMATSGSKLPLTTQPMGITLTSRRHSIPPITAAAPPFASTPARLPNCHCQRSSTPAQSASSTSRL